MPYDIVISIFRVDAVFLDHLSQDIRGTNSSAVWRYLIAYKNLLRSIENIGIAVVYGIRYSQPSQDKTIFSIKSKHFLLDKCLV